MGQFSKRVHSLVKPFLMMLGAPATINLQAVLVITRDSDENVLSGKFAGLITAAGAGYAKGCMMLNTSTGKWAQNEGTASSCSFVVTSPAERSIVKTQTCAVADFTDNEDTTGTLETGIVLPIGAIVKQAYLTQIVGFAGDTSAVITIGDGTDVDRYNTGTPNVFTTADEVAAGVPSGVDYHAAEKTVTLIITGAADFSLIVTEANGTLELTVEYIKTV